MFRLTRWYGGQGSTRSRFLVMGILSAGLHWVLLRLIGVSLSLHLLVLLTIKVGFRSRVIACFPSELWTHWIEPANRRSATRGIIRPASIRAILRGHALCLRGRSIHSWIVITILRVLPGLGVKVASRR